MLVYFIYDASSCTIFNREEESVPGYEKQELGRYIVDLQPLHLSREIKVISKKLKRLGYTRVHTHQRVCKEVAHGLRAKEHFCIELGH